MTPLQPTAFSSSDILRRSIPLMFAALSTNIMSFFDRLMLARYSLDAMSATAAADMIFFSFMMIAVAITGIAEIFVGRYHGAQEYEKMGKPVWQMLWLSLFISLICAPLGWLLKDWLLIPAFQKEGGNYLWLLMSFVGLSAANAAVSAFFIGKGETKWITVAVFIANICNIILNSVLIFGWKFIPCLGTTGAALATILSQTIQLIFLTSIFLNRKHRTFYKTADYKLDIKLLQACIKLGFPTALSHGFEMASWAYLTSFLAMHDTAYVTIQVVGNTLFNLFGFLTEGLQKGVTSLAANIMGSNNRQLIYHTKRSAFRVQYAFTAILSIPLLIYPDHLISLFLQDVPLEVIAKVKLTLMGVWGYFFLDGLNWVLVGLITSAGYTGYTMLANTSAWWIGALCPCFVAVHYFHIPAHMIWMILPLYTLLHFGLLYYKFKTINWEKGLVLDKL